MITVAVIAAMMLGELQHVEVGDGIRVRSNLPPLHDPLAESLARDEVTVADRVSLTLTFGPAPGADVEDVRTVMMLPGQKRLRVQGVCGALDASTLTMADPENPERIQLTWACLLQPFESSADIERRLLGERVIVESPSGPLGYSQREGILAGVGDRRTLAIDRDLHVLNDEPLVVPEFAVKFVLSPTLDLRFAQDGAAKQLALRYHTAGVSSDVRYTLDLRRDFSATLVQRAGIYTGEGLGDAEATIQFVVPGKSRLERSAVLRYENVPLREGATVWTTCYQWEDVPYTHTAENTLEITGAGNIDQWLPAGKVALRLVDEAGVGRTIDVVEMPLTAPGTKIVLPLP